MDLPFCMELDLTLIKDQIKLLIGPRNIAMAFKLHELDDSIHPMDNPKEIANDHHAQIQQGYGRDTLWRRQGHGFFITIRRPRRPLGSIRASYVKSKK